MADVLSGRTSGVIPWSNIWKLTCRYRLVLYGYPSPNVRDPIYLRIKDLRLLIDRLHMGSCGLRRVSEVEFRELSLQREADILSGKVKLPPARKVRSDRGSVRGRHRNPKTRTKTRRRGKVICTPETVKE